MKTKKLILLSCLLIAALILTGCATSSEKQTQVDQTKEDQLLSEDEWGIKILGIRQTAAGHMLNFRYKITDPEKASPLVSLHARPYIIDQKTGKIVPVPNMAKVGSLRQRSREAKPDLIYFILFSNPDKFIKPGNKVTVVIGDFRVANLTVE